MRCNSPVFATAFLLNESVPGFLEPFCRCLSGFRCGTGHSGVEIFPDAGDGGRYCDYNPTTSTKTASEYLQGRLSYYISHSPACSCHYGGAQPPLLIFCPSGEVGLLEQLFLFTARGGSQVLDIQPVANIPLRKKRRGMCVND